ncbi:MAG: GNAT family N-acetyltransferase [Litoreibacter sp.]|nr:GNAT family N-acetyltransferase [Litoreibacter sp.]
MSVSFQTPTLETERLILRGPKPSDAEVFVAAYAEERMQYAGGPMAKRQAWNFFGTEIGHWVMRGYGMFFVTLKGDDTPLGIVGHWHPNTWPEKEVGWVLFSDAYEGKGYVTEAARACVDHAWRVLKWDSVVSYIDYANAGSIRVAERLGAKPDPDAVQPYPDDPCHVYRHPRPEGLA